jgi:hypothetical protein
LGNLLSNKINAMHNISTVSELLKPLNARLSDIQGQRVSANADQKFDYTKMLVELHRNLFVLPAHDLIRGLKSMQGMAMAIFAKKIDDYTANSEDEPLPWSKTTNEVFEAVTNELKYYQETIEEYIALTGQDAINENVKIDVDQSIHLPEKLSAEDFVKAGFEPILSEKEAAYMVSLLRDLKYSPNYSSKRWLSTERTISYIPAEAEVIYVSKAHHEFGLACIMFYPK